MTEEDDPWLRMWNSMAEDPQPNLIQVDANSLMCWAYCEWKRLGFESPDSELAFKAGFTAATNIFAEKTPKE